MPGGASDATKQTIASLRAIGEALTQYIVDYNGTPLDVGLYDLYSGAGAPALQSYLPKWNATDAWGSRWNYRPSPDGKTLVNGWAEREGGRWVTLSYTITSAGADRKVGTGDDIQLRDGEIVRLPDGVTTAQLSPEQAQRDTERRAEAINVALQQRRKESGGLPKELKEIPEAILPRGVHVDAWGRAFRYKALTPDGFRLASAGADGTFDTGDDHVLTWSPPDPRQQETVMRANRIIGAIHRFRGDNGNQMPATLLQVAPRYVPVEYLKDGWGRDFRWDRERVRSAGADGQFDTPDDHAAAVFQR